VIFDQFNIPSGPVLGVHLKVEEVCFGKSLVRRAKSEGENPVYYVLGQSGAGRYLFGAIIRFPDGSGYPVTAREMTAKEKRRYRKWKE